MNTTYAYFSFEYPGFNFQKLRNSTLNSKNWEIYYVKWKILRNSSFNSKYWEIVG